VPAMDHLHQVPSPRTARSWREQLLARDGSIGAPGNGVSYCPMPDSDMEITLDARVKVLPLMEQIWQRTRSQSPVPTSPLDGRHRARLAIAEKRARLRKNLGELESAVRRIGRIPEGPATLRGRVGGVLVRLIHRALFWLIPSLRQAHQQTYEALRLQAALCDEMAEFVLQAERDLSLLVRSADHRRAD